jgi:hypothetical protein
MKTLKSATMATGLAMGALASLVAVGGAVQAVPTTQEHYEVLESGRSDDCGFPVDYEVAGSGQLVVREVRGSDGQAYLGHNNFKFRTVITNPATGAWMVVSGQSLFTEMTATHVEGDIWEFTTHEAGQPFVVEDSTGTVIARSRGLVTYRALFDTLGDGQPGGEVLEVEVTGIHGVHEGSFDNICDFVIDLIG